MHFLHRLLSSDLGRHRPGCHHVRSLYDAAISIERPRDRGLDHAVAREGNLKPLLNLKNLIISEPSKSIPYSRITESKQALEIPFRPLDLIRTYPSVFQEVHPGSLNTQPDIKLTPEVISLSTEEDLLYQGVNYKQDVAERLLKLLMINRVNKIPISLLERLKWELGLPQDYENVIIPEFPDYFRVISGNNTGSKELELVFWSDEFAVSEMEKKGAKDGDIQFSLHYSTGFEMDKNYKKWLDEWQKLPYLSPYENATHLPVKSDESVRWAVAMLHELLNLFVGKKAERDSLMCVGDYLGLRSRFKLAFLHHPGIFYTSTKIGTQTVVLRDAYKRGAMIKRHALMDLRFKYVHLMNTIVVEEKHNSTQEKSSVGVKQGGVEDYEDSESGEEDDVEMDESSNDYEDDDSEEENESENETQRGRRKRELVNFEEKNSRRSVEKWSNGSSTGKNEYEDDDSEEEDESENETNRGRHNRQHYNFEEKNSRRNTERRSSERSTRKNEYESPKRVSRRTNVDSDGYVPRKREHDHFEEKNSRSTMERRSNRSTSKNEYESSNRFSRRSNDKPNGYVPRRSRQRTDDYEEGEGENGIKRRRFKRDFEDKNVRRSDSSTRFSRRMNIRDYANVNKKFPQNLDLSRNRERSRTGNANAE